MSPADGGGGIRAMRGPALTYVDDAFQAGIAAALRYEPDALIVMAAGRITGFGPAEQQLAALPPGTPVTSYGRDSLIMAGFIDCHVHYPQTQIIGAGGKQL